VRAPRVHLEAALLAATRDERPVVDLEAQPEPLLHLALPLERDRGGAHDEHEVDPLPQQQLLGHQPRLDRLSEADVLGDEEVRPGEGERLHERRELVAHQLDACPERRLEELRVGGRDRVPLERMQVGGEQARVVDRAHRAEPVRFRLQNARAQLELPCDREAPPLRVVVEAHQLHERRVARRRRRHDLLDEVLPMADVDDVAGDRHVRVTRGAPARGGRDGRPGLPRVEQPAHQVAARTAGVVEPVRAARGLQLVAAERAKQRVEARGRGRGERRDLLVLRRGRGQGDAQVAAELEHAGLGQKLEDGADGGGRHGVGWYIHAGRHPRRQRQGWAVTRRDETRGWGA
jgi:hypothetical protein